MLYWSEEELRGEAKGREGGTDSNGIQLPHLVVACLILMVFNYV
jgi:hypothetical protein